MQLLFRKQTSSPPPHNVSSRFVQRIHSIKKKLNQLKQFSVFSNFRVHQFKFVEIYSWTGSSRGKFRTFFIANGKKTFRVRCCFDWNNSKVSGEWRKENKTWNLNVPEDGATNSLQISCRTSISRQKQLILIVDLNLFSLCRRLKPSLSIQILFSRSNLSFRVLSSDFQLCNEVHWVVHLCDDVSRLSRSLIQMKRIKLSYRFCLSTQNKLLTIFFPMEKARMQKGKQWAHTKS